MGGSETGKPRGRGKKEREGEGEGEREKKETGEKRENTVSSNPSLIIQKTLLQASSIMEKALSGVTLYSVKNKKGTITRAGIETDTAEALDKSE